MTDLDWVIDDRKELLAEGRTLFSIIVKDLNDIDTHRRYHSFRRQEDHEEICIALALLARVTGIRVKGDH